MTTLLSRRFRYLLDVRGLLVAPSAHEERYVLRLSQGPIVIDRHPRAVREALMIARELYGEGAGEHGEMSALYARRDELGAPLTEAREIAWVQRTTDGPGLNPGKWVRLDAWIDDQFLMDDALKLRYEHVG
ncbi:MAG: hypothetical protein AAB554_04480 [Patescibacteria group bacterium]